MTDQQWARAEPERRDYRRDLLTALGLLVAASLSLVLYSVAGFYPAPAAAWVDIVFLLAISLPLAARRRYPEAVAIVIAIVFMGSQMLSVPELLICNISLFVAIYSVGAWGRNRRRALIVRVVIIVGMFVWLFAALVARASEPAAPATGTGSGSGGGTGTGDALAASGATASFVAVGLIQILTNLLYFGAAYYFGERARSAARARAALETRTVELAAEREINSERAVIRERVRIARDLHDVVAHHVSVMGVQAGAARRVVDTDRDQVVSSLQAIEASARSAVSELHRMLSTLRDDEQAALATDSPLNQGIEQLPALITRAQDAGLTVDFRSVGAARVVPATNGVVIYRVAQEAVTNTLKHAAPNARVDVRLRYLDEAVEVEISDSGHGAQLSPIGSGAGLGLVGMRERVAAVGGTITIGPSERGGYLVRATIPTPEPAA